MSSEQRFGYEWNKYSWVTKDYERQFRNWTHPLTPADWNGKRVLDAGCGMGRNSYWPLRYGAMSVTAFDYDERSVASAKNTLSKFKNTEVLYKSIYDIDWENQYDIVFSIGVIHHLMYPRRALARMINTLKPEGRLLIWVYCFEGNEWIVRFVDPIRIHITSKLPLPIIHFLSYFCSVPLYVFVKIFKGPNIYLKQLSAFSFWHIHSIVFDQLIPEIAHYWNKDEVESLVRDLPIGVVSVEHTPEGTGWILRGIKL